MRKKYRCLSAIPAIPENKGERGESRGKLLRSIASRGSGCRGERIALPIEPGQKRARKFSADQKASSHGDLDQFTSESPVSMHVSVNNHRRHANKRSIPSYCVSHLRITHGQGGGSPSQQHGYCYTTGPAYQQNVLHHG